MPNVDLAVKAEVVNYDRHGFSRPNLWHRPIAKVAFVIMLFHWYLFDRMCNMLTKHDGVYVINRCAYFDQKVYDVNRITGNVLYRPMINYINKKVFLWLVIKFIKFWKVGDVSAFLHSLSSNVQSGWLRLMWSSPGGFQDFHRFWEQRCSEGGHHPGEANVIFLNLICQSLMGLALEMF